MKMSYEMKERNERISLRYHGDTAAKKAGREGGSEVRGQEGVNFNCF